MRLFGASARAMTFIALLALCLCDSVACLTRLF